MKIGEVRKASNGQFIKLTDNKDGLWTFFMRDQDLKIYMTATEEKIEQNSKKILNPKK